MRRHPPHHLSPARANHPAGQDPEARLAAPSHHSNAPINTESQSFLSKKVALTERIAARSSGLVASDIRFPILGIEIRLSKPTAQRTMATPPAPTRFRSNRLIDLHGVRLSTEGAQVRSGLSLKAAT